MFRTGRFLRKIQTNVTSYPVAARAGRVRGNQKRVIFQLKSVRGYRVAYVALAATFSFMVPMQGYIYLYPSAIGLDDASNAPPGATGAAFSHEGRRNGFIASIAIATAALAPYTMLLRRLVSKVTLLPGRQLQIYTMGVFRTQSRILPLDLMYPPFARNDHTYSLHKWEYIDPATGSMEHFYVDIGDSVYFSQSAYIATSQEHDDLREILNYNRANGSRGII